MNEILGFTVKEVRNFYRKFESFIHVWMGSHAHIPVEVYLTRFLPVGYGGVCDLTWNYVIDVGTGHENSGVFGRQKSVSDLDVI